MAQTNWLLVGGAFLVLVIFMTIGLIGFFKEAKRVQTYNERIDAGDPDPEAEPPTPAQKLENQKKSCGALSLGTAPFVRKFAMQRFPTDDTAVIKGVTAKYGVPWSCKVEKNESKCTPDTEFFDMNLENDSRFYNPKTFMDAPFARDSFRQYHFRVDDTSGTIKGMTGDEASAACFLSEDCGSFVLPACEFGFKFFTKENLNDFLAADGTIAESKPNWLESSKFFENGSFIRDACVRVKPNANELIRGGSGPAKKGDDDEEFSEMTKTFEFSRSAMMNLLDFSSMRSLNFDNSSMKEDMYAPVRSGYYFPKSKKASTDPSLTGAKGKAVATVDKMYSFEVNSRAKNIPTDAYSMQFWTGTKDQEYSRLEAGVAYPTPCDAVNKLAGEELLSMCSNALGDDGWVPMRCEIRETRSREILPVSERAMTETTVS